MTRPLVVGLRWAACAAIGALVLGCTSDRKPEPARQGGAAAGSSVCERSAQGEAGDLALARCLATPELLPDAKQGGAPVTVYFDRRANHRFS